MIHSFFLAVCLAPVSGPSALVVDQAEVNKGTAKTDRPLTHTFRLTNRSTGPLTIVGVRTGCGCSRQEVDRKALKSGESTDLLLSFNLMSQPEGPNRWAAVVRYRDADGHESELPLTVTAQVVKDVRIEPIAVLIVTEGQFRAQLTVIDRRTDPLRISGGRIGTKGITIEPGAIERKGPESRQTVDVVVSTDCPVGNHSEELILDSADPTYKEIRVPVRVVKRSPTAGVSASPSTVVLRPAADQQTVSALVRLKDAGDAKVAITGWESTHDAVSAKWAEGPGNAATVRIVLDRRKVVGDGIAVVTVRFGETKSSETMAIPVSWFLSGPIK